MLLALAWSLRAAAVPACVAADVCSPTADPCVVAQAYEIGDLCLLDFGFREVQVAGTGRLDVGVGSATIRAGTLRILAGSQVRGRDGGQLVLQIDEDVDVDGAVDFTTDSGGGRFEVNADRIWVRNLISANGRNGYADGSAVVLDAQGLVQIDNTIDAHGGGFSSGGSIVVRAGTHVTVGATLDASGGEFDGGLVDLSAGGDITLLSGTLNANGGGAGGYGGQVKVVAGGDIVSAAILKANGAGGGGYGGDGGIVRVDGGGRVEVNNTVQANGAAPDGYGGVMRLLAGGDLLVDAQVDVVGSGSESGGGELIVRAAAASFVRVVDVHGGAGGGGIITITASDLSLPANVLATGGGVGGDGGSIEATVSGPITVGALLQAQADAQGGLGSILLDGCAITLQSTATLDTDTGAGGTNRLVAHELLIVDGDLRASASNTLSTRWGTPQIGPTATIVPPPLVVRDPLLTTCCPSGDTDSDGVCDLDDVCPGGDDHVDLDGDGWPDACPLTVSAPVPGYAGVENVWHVTGGAPGQKLYLGASLATGIFFPPVCPNVNLGLGQPRALVDTAIVAADGTADLSRVVPQSISGRTAWYQVVEVPSCRVTPLAQVTF